MTISTRAVWAAYGAVATAMVVTYARVDPSALYNVSRTGAWAACHGRSAVAR